MKYVNYADYTREMDFHNGTIEIIVHCGRCMSIKPFKGADCAYCKGIKAKKDAALQKLKDHVAYLKGEDLT